MSDGFYRIPCKTCQIPFIPSSEKNVFCCRECSLDYHRPGAYKERLQFRAQMKRTVEILNGEMNPPIPLPINPPPSAGVS
jgi:ribosomal protein L37AE/L43A